MKVAELETINKKCKTIESKNEERIKLRQEEIK